MILAINGCDKIEPLQGHYSSVPGAEQLQSIEKKIVDLRRIFTDLSSIVPCSAATGWNLGMLSHEIAQLLARSEGVCF